MKVFDSITTSMFSVLLAAVSSSSTLSLNSYSFGSGGTNNSSSSTYSLDATTGSLSGKADSTTTGGNTGFVESIQANVPLAPTLSNGGGTYYNKLDFTINMNADPTDYVYSVAVSTDNFATTNFVQTDGTLGGGEVYRTYAAWGGSGGSTMSGLTFGTTYQVKVAAMHGKFTNSIYGAAASLATASPSMSFSLTPNTINLGSLSAGTVISAGTDISVGFTTNAASGGIVYIAGQHGGLRSLSANNTITSSTGALSSAAEGFGAQGVSATQTSGGAFAISSPFNGTSTTVGGIGTTLQPLFASLNPVVGGNGAANIKAKASVVTPAAADYSEILTVVASASY